MPSRFIVRNLRENSSYHIYNRGTVEAGIFRDTQDYRVFLFYLYIYTTPIEQVIQKFSDLPMRLREKSLVGKLDILAYNLMPDHFHLVVHQHIIDGMPKLMKQVINGYTVYFNQKYKHHGSVFLGRYKAVEVPESHLADVVRYVHLKDLESPWSSYKKYAGQEAPLDCNTSKVLNIFGTQDSFLKTHQDTQDFEASLPQIKHLTID